MSVRTLRRSPIAQWHEAHAAAWVKCEGMLVPSSYATAWGTAVYLEDLSWRGRVGCKGEGAASHLEALGWPVPESWNSWLLDPEGVLVARLGISEFLLEATGTSQARAVSSASQSMPPRVYPVMRQDFTFALGGPRARELLSEVCGLDLRSLVSTCTERSGQLALTLLAGVSVTMAPRAVDGDIEFTIWCDPSFAGYLWATLIAIARDLGGGAVAHRSATSGYGKGGADGQSTSSGIL